MEERACQDCHRNHLGFGEEWKDWWGEQGIWTCPPCVEARIRARDKAREAKQAAYHAALRARQDREMQG